jgi:hypothetical protein
VVPPGSDHVSRQWSYSGTRSTGWCAFTYGTIALYGARFHSTSASTQLCNCRWIGHDPDTSPTTPGRQRVSAFTCPVWASPRSLATTRGVSVDFRSSGYLDVSVLPVSSRRLCIQRRVTPHYRRRVFPFGDPRVEGCSAPHRGLSQPSTSFFGS